MGNNSERRSSLEDRSDDNPAVETTPGLFTRYRDWRIRHREELRKNPAREWTELIITIIVIVFVVRLTVVEAFRIPSSSMEDTLLIGDFLLVNKFIYGMSSPDWIGIPFTRIGVFVPFFRLPSIREPRQGDVVVFRYPLDPNLSYIKRLVATEGQTIEIHDKQVFVEGKAFKTPPHSKFVSKFLLPTTYIDNGIWPRNLEMRNRDNYGPLTVPKGMLFVMGDNRDNSADSRYWGFLPRDKVVGKALIIYFSFDKRKPWSKFHEKIRWERIGNLIR